MSAKFEYVRLGKFYVNSSMSLAKLTRHLWSQTEQFLGDEGKSRSSNGKLPLLPDHVRKAMLVARKLRHFVVARRGPGKERGPQEGLDSLLLPVAGDLALVRRSGAIKVLDVERHRVHTLMLDPSQSERLRERVELATAVGDFPFAPSVSEAALDRGYFSEEFVSGSHPQDFVGCTDDFAAVYRPLLVEFLLAFPPRWVGGNEYVDSLVRDILDPKGLIQELPAAQREKISRFTKETRERIAPLEQLPLVLSHGDYFSGNMVISEAGHRAIDWANLGYRTPLHDLHYLYMNHCRRVLDHDALTRCSTGAMRSVRQALRSASSERYQQLSPYLNPDPALRRLFYLECVQVPLVRCDDPSDRYLSSMLQRIDWFEEYEMHESGETARPEVVTQGSEPKA